MNKQTFSDWVAKWVPQMAHVFAGAYCTLFLALILLLADDRPWYSIVVMVGFATIKEGIFDPIMETIAEQGSGVQDWLFWILGITIGYGSLLLLAELFVR